MNFFVIFFVYKKINLQRIGIIMVHAIESLTTRI